MPIIFNKFRFKCKYINNIFMSKIPWVEYYRPTKLTDIVLEEKNKEILHNIISNNYFPNLLFYGPPGTGKTTTIINLINSYQTKYYGKICKELVTHLNASDERGIDIIRNQISAFVKSKNLFNYGLKFVILDEVDYMTKNAQQALKYLLQNNSNNHNVRFCLICNYISKIDEGLQNEFIKLRFDQLPKNEIIGFLNNILVCENISIKEDVLVSLYNMFGSDIRSMINYLQAHNINDTLELKIIDVNVLENIVTTVKTQSHANTISFIFDMCNKYNIDVKNIIKKLLSHIIQTGQNMSPEFLDFFELLLHSDITNDHVYTSYALLKLQQFL